MRELKLTLFNASLTRQNEPFPMRHCPSGTSAFDAFPRTGRGKTRGEVLPVLGYAALGVQRPAQGEFWLSLGGLDIGPKAYIPFLLTGEVCSAATASRHQAEWFSSGNSSSVERLDPRD